MFLSRNTLHCTIPMQPSSKPVHSKLVAAFSSSVPLFFNTFSERPCHSALVLLAANLPHKAATSIRYAPPPHTHSHTHTLTVYTLAYSPSSQRWLYGITEIL